MRGAGLAMVAWSVLGAQGCYLQLSGGLYAVQGGHRGGGATPTAVVPSVGVAVGVAYDPLVVRAMAGVGTQSVTLPGRTPTEVAVTGPAHLQLDFAVPYIADREHYARRSSVLRVGVGGTTQWGQRFVTNPADGALEARSMNVFHVYLPVSYDLLIGNAPFSFLTAGISLAPGLFAGLDNGTADLWGYGADIRLTFALPITPHNGINLGEIFRSHASPQEVEEMRQLAQQVQEWEARRAGNRFWQMSGDSNRALGQTQERLDQLNCINRGGTRCTP